MTETLTADEINAGVGVAQGFGNLAEPPAAAKGFSMSGAVSTKTLTSSPVSRATRPQAP